MTGLLKNPKDPQTAAWNRRCDCMENNQLDDVSDIDVGETIEQKTYRLMQYAYGENLNSLDDAMKTHIFRRHCHLVDIAIAEEREACKAVCMKAKGTGISGANDDFKDGFETGAEVCIVNINARGEK